MPALFCPPFPDRGFLQHAKRLQQSASNRRHEIFRQIIPAFDIEAGGFQRRGVFVEREGGRQAGTRSATGGIAAIG